MEQRAMGLTEIELEVLDFMEELRLARLRPSPSPSPSPRGLTLFAWGSKRRRSAIDRSPSPLSPPTPKKSKVSSPATTLAFPPSESEEKVSSTSISKPVKIVTLSKLPKKIEDLLKQCDSLSTERQELLQVKEEMVILKRKLEEDQSFLKEKLLVEKVKQRQHQQRLCLESEPPATSLALDFTLAQPTVNAHHHHHHHHRPLIVDQTAGERCSAYQPSVLSPCTTSTREELFDLNVAPAEEAPAPAVAPPFQAVFLNLRSLEMARRNRMMRKEKMRSKNSARFRAVR